MKRKIKIIKDCPGYGYKRKQVLEIGKEVDPNHARMLVQSESAEYVGGAETATVEGEEDATLPEGGSKKRK